MLKSLTIYQLTQATPAILDRLDDALKSHPFKECKKIAAKAAGFISPLSDSSKEVSYTTNGGTLFCLRQDIKEVPAGAVREMVDAMAAEKTKDGEEFSIVDKRLARDEILERLLPGTTPKPVRTFAYIDHSLHMMFVGGNEQAGDDFIEQLKKAFDSSVPVKLLGLSEVDPCDKYTEWLKDTSLLGEHFKLGHQGSFKLSEGEGGCAIINVKNDNLKGDAYAEMLEEGYTCCSVALVHEHMGLRLTSKLGVRNIDLGEKVKAEGFDEDAGAPTTSYEFAAFVTAMREVIQALEPLLGEWPRKELLDLREQQDQEDAA